MAKASEWKQFVANGTAIIDAYKSADRAKANSNNK
jgi:hypothetical protein